MNTAEKQRRGRVDPVTIANTLQLTNEQRLAFADRLVTQRGTYGFGSDGLVDLEASMKLAQRGREEVA